MEQRICINPKCKQEFNPVHKTQCLCKSCFEDLNLKVIIFKIDKRHDVRSIISVIKFGQFGKICYNCGKSTATGPAYTRKTTWKYHYCNECFSTVKVYKCFYNILGCGNVVKTHYPVCDQCYLVENKFCPSCGVLLTPPANKYVKYNDVFYCNKCMPKTKVENAEFEGIEVKLTGSLCPRCQTRNVESSHHIIPREYGGSDTSENRILLCNICHDEVEVLTDNLYKANKYYTIDQLKSFILGSFPKIEVSV